MTPALVAAVTDELELTLVVISILLGVAALLRGGVRLLRKMDDLSALAESTHKEVSENGNRNKPPTLKDQVSDVGGNVAELRALLERMDKRTEEQAATIAGFREWQDEHNAWSTAEVHRIWSYILDVEKRGEM